MKNVTYSDAYKDNIPINKYFIMCNISPPKSVNGITTTNVINPL